MKTCPRSNLASEQQWRNLEIFIMRAVELYFSDRARIIIRAMPESWVMEVFVSCKVPAPEEPALTIYVFVSWVNFKGGKHDVVHPETHRMKFSAIMCQIPRVMHIWRKILGTSLFLPTLKEYVPCSARQTVQPKYSSKQRRKMQCRAPVPRFTSGDPVVWHRACSRCCF